MKTISDVSDEPVSEPANVKSEKKDVSGLIIMLLIAIGIFILINFLNHEENN